jgi:hypothetical protein
MRSTHQNRAGTRGLMAKETRRDASSLLPLPPPRVQARYQQIEGERAGDRRYGLWQDSPPTNIKRS